MTTVAAFNVAGAILIVALMIAPPAAAYLLSDRLSGLLGISAIVAVVSSVTGFYVALGLDIAPTGPMASMAGVVFSIVFALAHPRGIVTTWVRRWRQKQTTIDCLILDAFARRSPDEATPAAVAHSLSLPATVIERSVARLRQNHLLRESGERYEVTDAGNAYLETVIGDRAQKMPPAIETA